jgi:hypothetical protein
VGQINTIFGIFCGHFEQVYPLNTPYALTNSQEESVGNNSRSPDFGLGNLDITSRAHSAGEVVYSQGLSDGHHKAQFYLNEIPHIRAVIIICVRYPWSIREDNYDQENSSMVFLYYERNNIGDQRGPVAPGFVCSFGSM